MSHQLNQRAFALAEQMIASADELRVDVSTLDNGARIIDCGVKAEGGLAAGLALARICMSDLAKIELTQGSIEKTAWPYILVRTDAPTPSCLLSQYAGWQVSVDKYFAMGSGPMRAAAAREDLFAQLNYKETSDCCVGILESGQLPDVAVVNEICTKANVSPEKCILLVAPTSSMAGNVQVVARSIETALHKLHELEFDVNRIRSAAGWAPLSPVAADDLTGIGRTNDAILYGGCVTLYVNGNDESIEEIGPKVPANSSGSYGQPFLEVFEAAGRDFYQIDSHLFSPAEVVFQNLETGRVWTYGQTDAQVLQKSFQI